MKQYFGVVYLENGDACICSSCESDKKLTLFDLFGHPRSRDLMQDKKFLQTL